MKPITRRRWLIEAAAIASLPGTLWSSTTGGELIDFADCEDFMVERQADNPRVKCFDLRRLSEPFTPNAEFFVFHQTTVPTIALDRWVLQIGGFVERPKRFTWTELTGLPMQELEFTIECSGNLPRSGTMNGQIGNARWSGVSLATILAGCGIKPEAREVVFFGADTIKDGTDTPVRQHGRSVFVQDALHSDAILATKMNGEPLPVEHGFPLRLILPGWYGMAQIKWLSRIEVIDRRFEGMHMSRNYQTVRATQTGDQDPLLMETSISKTRLKSVVARVTRTRQGLDRAYRVAGAAWGGPVPIERVELRIDQGQWSRTNIDRRGGKYGWLLWSYDWKDATPGRHTLTSRAIDAQGKLQPTPDELRSEIVSVRENNAQWTRVIEIS